jgi:RNA polymerase sigma factor for flagellar operon FliA
VADRVDRRVGELGSLIDSFARRFHRRLRKSVPLEDLLAFGHEGAHRAAMQWDGRGQLRSFAAQRIKWAIIDGLRRAQRRRTKREARFTADLTALTAAERAADALDPPGDAGLDADDRAAMAHLIASAALGYTLDLVVATADIDLAVDDRADVEREAEHMRLRRVVSALPDPERMVVERHHFAGETFQEIAEITGSKSSTVSDLHARALKRLRKELGSSLPPAP